MSVYFPQAALQLRVVWEDFDPQSKAVNLKAQVINVIAKSVHVNINDYTQADTFSAELDYKTFPFDPRFVRSLGVSVYMQDMKKLYDGQGDPVKIEPSPENVVFQGFADEESIKFDENSRTVSFEGRDFTSILIDAPIILKTPLPMDQPLDALIQSLLNGLEAAKEIKVENRTLEPLPSLAKFGAGLHAEAGNKNPKKDEKYWDLIQNLVGRLGLICFIEIDKLVITKPQALYDETKAKQFIYGKNLSRLSFKRKLGRMKQFNIRVLSLSYENKELTEAKIPIEATEEFALRMGIAREPVKKVTPTPNGGEPKVEEAPYYTFRVPDVANKAKLIEIGQNIFEEVGRQQIEGSFETMDMTCTEGKAGTIFDVTKLRNGTPILLEIDQDDLAEISRMKSESARAEYLRLRSYAPQVAASLAATMGKITPLFYTKAVELSMDSTEGFKCKLDFVNFIQINNRILK